MNTEELIGVSSRSLVLEESDVSIHLVKEILVPPDLTKNIDADTSMRWLVIKREDSDVELSSEFNNFDKADEHFIDVSKNLADEEDYDLDVDRYNINTESEIIL